MYRANYNIFYLPNLGENLTDEDQAAFYQAGLPLPSFAHGPRGCVADYYASDDRLDADNMRRFELLKADDLRFNDPCDSRNMSIVARVRNRIVRAHDQEGWELTAAALY